MKQRGAAAFDGRSVDLMLSRQDLLLSVRLHSLLSLEDTQRVSTGRSYKLNEAVSRPESKNDRKSGRSDDRKSGRSYDKNHK